MKRFYFALAAPMWLGLASLIATGTAARRVANEPQPVIYDNDWSVSGAGYVCEPSLMPLLTDPHIALLGLTAATGDFWRDEGAATLLRFLEIIGATGVPVYRGAVFPLVNSASRHAAWEARYGTLSWSGAWNDPARDARAHPHDPDRIIPPREGMPTIARAAAQDAVSFMIDAVHRHPGRVTIYAEGPLTNIALAVRRDPDIARQARRIVVQAGAAVAAGGKGGSPADFNIMFDPEAARIVLTAPWREIVMLGDVSNRLVLTPAVQRRIAAIDTPAARFAAANASVGLPLWAQAGAAIIADPTLIRRATRMMVDVSIVHDRSYGRIRRARASSSSRRRPLTFVTKVDERRLIDAYVDSLRKPVLLPSAGR